MANIYILCVEDEPDVLDALVRDLATFEHHFPVEATSSVAEARDVAAAISASGGTVGLVLADHQMPGETGVDLLVELNRDDRFHATRKVLITGQAGLEATVRAVNDADLDHYIAKPWQQEELTGVVVNELTSFVIAAQTDLVPYLAILDSERIAAAMRRGGAPPDR